MPFLVMVGLMAAVFVPLAAYAQHRAKLAAAEAQRLAAQYGFLCDVKAKQPPPQQFDLFRAGSSRRLSYHFWRPEEQDSVFQYQYTTGSGDDRRTHDFTCALVALPFNAPHTKIGPESFLAGIGKALGIRDIEVESPEFNDAFKVSSDDPRFAIALLDQPMIAWMLSSESGRGSIRFELWGSWLLCISSKRLEVERMFGYLDWGQGVRPHMPTVLTSLYPLR